MKTTILEPWETLHIHRRGGGNFELFVGDRIFELGETQLRGLETELKQVNDIYAEVDRLQKLVEELQEEAQVAERNREDQEIEIISELEK